MVSPREWERPVPSHCPRWYLKKKKKASQLSRKAWGCFCVWVSRNLDNWLDFGGILWWKVFFFGQLEVYSIGNTQPYGIWWKVKWWRVVHGFFFGSNVVHGFVSFVCLRVCPLFFFFGQPRLSSYVSHHASGFCSGFWIGQVCFPLKKIVIFLVGLTQRKRKPKTKSNQNKLWFNQPSFFSTKNKNQLSFFTQKKKPAQFFDPKRNQPCFLFDYSISLY